MKHYFLTITALAAGAVCAYSQVGMPYLGLVPDGTKIRTMAGIPAAASINGTVDAGTDLQQIVASGEFALGVSSDTGAPLLIVPPSAAVNLAGVASGADRIALSPRGSSAVFWFNASSKGQVVSGLPSAPQLVGSVDASFLTSAPSRIAVSDDGTEVAGIWRDGIYSFGPSGAITHQAMIGATALTFFANRDDLLVAVKSEVISIASAGGAVSVVYAGTEPSSGPKGREESPASALAVATTSDNTKAVVTDIRGNLATIDLASGTASTTQCGCTPEGLFPLGGSLFRLTGLAAGVHLFDASSGGVLSVPSLLTAGGAQ